MGKYVKRKVVALTILLGTVLMLTNSFTKSVKAAGIGTTFEEQFPNAHTAQVIAEYFGRVSTDEIDSADLNETDLYLPNKGLEDLSGLEIFTKLQQINVNDNSLTAIPDDILDMPDLYLLYANNNQISQFPTTWAGSHLSYLYLQGNQMTVLPDNIGELTTLITLYLDFNNLTTLPDTLENIGPLRDVWVEYNPNFVLPESITRISNLSVLKMAGTNQTTVPEAVSRIANLNNLGLEDNLITEIPPYLADIPKLEYLYLNGNQLSSFPEFMSTLNMVQIDLAKNRFIAIPDFISNYPKLEYLSFEGNQLTSLPGNFLDLALNSAWIHTINVDNNLLPSNVNEYLAMNGFSGYNLATQVEVALGPTQQDELQVTGTPIFDIRSQSDFDVINYVPSLGLKSGSSLFSEHVYQLENYVDENSQPVNIVDYLQNGKVIKEGVVYAQVRATGDGLFPNSSDRALATNPIQMNFIIPIVDYTLDFDLNGASGSIPASQTLTEGEKAVKVDDPTRDGYTFKGWNTQRDGTGDTWDFAVSTMPASSITLYAQWQKNDSPIPPVNPVNPVHPTNPENLNNIPKTGDETNVIGWSLLLIGVGIAILNLRRFKACLRLICR